MKNTIAANIEFSFKGEDYSLTSNIDIDRLMQREHPFPSIHAILAHDNHIDTYSYLYEVMLEAEIRFSDARGIAEDFLVDGNFDQEGFMKAWQESKVVEQLQPIAMRELGIADLDQHRELKNALVQAYNLGKGA
ncbi:MAG: hypothetical protein OEV15_01205 [Gallionella sp.]|nr:hypothetical protein [Gallionella sp.]